LLEINRLIAINSWAIID